jgi:hypothetical protein
VITLTAAAHCISGCDWNAAGDPDAADKAAVAHGRKTGHPTATVTEAVR